MFLDPDSGACDQRVCARRRIVSHVHPDRFADHPEAQAANTESLKKLLNLASDFERGDSSASVPLRFYKR